MELLKFIDIAGIAAFSIAGAFAAMEKKLDVFGIFIIAFVTALGGGTLRDVLIGELPVRWMYDLSMGLVVFLSAAAAMLFTTTLQNMHKILLLFDALGLAFFTLVGLQKGIALGLHPAMSVALGTITACFGGVIRDIALNNIPVLFQKEIYATACIIGGILYFLLSKIGVSNLVIEMGCIASIIAVRLLALRHNWQLPVLKNK